MGLSSLLGSGFRPAAQGGASPEFGRRCLVTSIQQLPALSVAPVQPLVPCSCRAPPAVPWPCLGACSALGDGSSAAAALGALVCLPVTGRARPHARLRYGAHKQRANPCRCFN